MSGERLSSTGQSLTDVSTEWLLLVWVYKKWWGGNVTDVIRVEMKTKSIWFWTAEWKKKLTLSILCTTSCTVASGEYWQLTSVLYPVHEGRDLSLIEVLSASSDEVTNLSLLNMLSNPLMTASRLGGHARKSTSGRDPIEIRVGRVVVILPLIFSFFLGRLLLYLGMFLSATCHCVHIDLMDVTLWDWKHTSAYPPQFTKNNQSGTTAEIYSIIWKEYWHVIVICAG